MADKKTKTIEEKAQDELKQAGERHPEFEFSLPVYALESKEGVALKDLRIKKKIDQVQQFSFQDICTYIHHYKTDIANGHKAIKRAEAEIEEMEKSLQVWEDEKAAVIAQFPELAKEEAQLSPFVEQEDTGEVNT